MDVTKPTDQVLVSELPAYIREARVAINALSAGTGVGVTELVIPTGSTLLSVSSELGTYGFEVVLVSADAVVNISNILGGHQGQVKIFVFQDNLVKMIDGQQALGELYLNQLPALSSFDAQTNDVLALVNIGGDGSTIQGYWKEIFRQNAMK